MPSTRSLSRFPASFAANSRAPGRKYRRREDCFAVRVEAGHPPASDAAAAPGGRRLLYRLEAEHIEVFEGQPDEVDEVDEVDEDAADENGVGDEAEHELIAAYSFSRTDQPAVPTGRVFVIFDTKDDVSAPGADLGGTSYRIESRPGYAPQAAWIVARDGSVATALAGLGALAERPDVASVEPQMLRPIARRDQ